MYMHIRAHTHTYMHTYLHTYILTFQCNRILAPRVTHHKIPSLEFLRLGCRHQRRWHNAGRCWLVLAG